MDARQAARLSPTPDDALACWGRDAPPGVQELADATGLALWRMEDGFLRSVGLGSDMVPPRSIVLDTRGIYFDPAAPSDLEHLLCQREFTDEDLARARFVREQIVRHGLTKYNVEPRTRPQWPAAGREVVLVPGQVEDDASIRYGTTAVNTNLGLLQQARQAHPEAFIVYKPHPDVVYGNRQGGTVLKRAAEYADHIETQLSVISCIEACHVVHTMTSLAGFDSLLRGKRVVTYGEPFYAGWGLTEDRVTQGRAMNRRQRRLSLDELVAGALLHYPIYWDPVKRCRTTCEVVIEQIITERNALEASGRPLNRRLGWWQRQWRKGRIIISAWLRR